MADIHCTYFEPLRWSTMRHQCKHLQWPSLRLNSCVSSAQGVRKNMAFEIWKLYGVVFFWLFPIVVVSLFAPKPTFASIFFIGFLFGFPSCHGVTSNLATKGRVLWQHWTKRRSEVWWPRFCWRKKTKMTSPIPSMYGIFTYVYHKIQLNVR